MLVVGIGSGGRSESTKESVISCFCLYCFYLMSLKCAGPDNRALWVDMGDLLFRISPVLTAVS